MASPPKLAGRGKVRTPGGVIRQDWIIKPGVRKLVAAGKGAGQNLMVMIRQAARLNARGVQFIVTPHSEVTNLAPEWRAIPAQSLTVGQDLDLNLLGYVTDPEGQPLTITANGTLPAWMTLTNGRLSGRPTASDVGSLSISFVADDGYFLGRFTMSVGTATAAGYVPALNVNDGSAESDWLARTTGPLATGVVWAHDFRNTNEVDNFRWTGGYGNDPTAVGSPRAGQCRWINTDGITGGCLEVTHLAGFEEGSYWWRPFSPMQGGTTTGNGRGVNDPGAGLTLQAWTPTNKSQTADWGRPYNARRGLYTNAAYNTLGDADGSDFYIQFRVKMDPRRLQVAETVGGKFIWLTHTFQSYTDQELVTYSYGGGRDFGKNLFRVYRGSGYLALEQCENGVGPYNPQTNSALGLCDIRSPGLCWGWSGGWDTVLYHITPGTKGMANTHFEAWVCTAGQEAGGYVKIWDQSYNIVDNYPNSPQDEVGWSATICSAYNNGSYGVQTMTDFYHRYAQIIFSKSYIPCPTV